MLLLIDLVFLHTRLDSFMVTDISSEKSIYFKYSIFIVKYSIGKANFQIPFLQSNTYTSS